MKSQRWPWKDSRQTHKRHVLIKAGSMRTAPRPALMQQCTVAQPYCQTMPTSSPSRTTWTSRLCLVDEEILSCRPTLIWPPRTRSPRLKELCQLPMQSLNAGWSRSNRRSPRADLTPYLLADHSLSHTRKMRVTLNKQRLQQRPSMECDLPVFHCRISATLARQSASKGGLSMMVTRIG